MNFAWQLTLANIDLRPLLSDAVQLCHHQVFGRNDLEGDLRVS